MRQAILSSIATILLLAVGGCNVAGTSSIRNGRAAYNAAIVETNNEQFLAMIVRMRYQEPAGLLAVAHVTANMRIQARVGAEFGVGPNSNFAGNLVPLTAGALYEENPTISYTPLQGESYLRQVLSPLPADLTVLLLGAMGQSPATLELLLKEINGIRNPGFVVQPDDDGADSRFAHAVGLLSALHRRGTLTWVRDAAVAPGSALVLDGDEPEDAEMIASLAELLGLDPPDGNDGLIRLPVHVGGWNESAAAIRLRTQSVYDLMLLAAMSVDVPPEHTESGMAPSLPPGATFGGPIHIRRSDSRPLDALVAIEHHGWWYWIAATDGRSKQTFRMLEAIATARLADTADRRSSPIQTVPVSR